MWSARKHGVGGVHGTTARMLNLPYLSIGSNQTFILILGRRGGPVGWRGCGLECVTIIFSGEEWEMGVSGGGGGVKSTIVNTYL